MPTFLLTWTAPMSTPPIAHEEFLTLGISLTSSSVISWRKLSALEVACVIRLGPPDQWSPTFFGTRGQFCWKTIFPWIGVEGDGFRMIQAHDIYLYYCYISSTSDHQALGPRVWGPLHQTLFLSNFSGAYIIWFWQWCFIMDSGSQD